MKCYLTYQTSHEMRRAEQAEDFKRDMAEFITEQEKEYARIRKYTYQAMKSEVKRGIRNSTDLMEFEIWKGF